MIRQATRSVLALVVLAITAPVATADEDEHRVSVAGVVATIDLDAFATSDTTQAYGGTVGAAWGIRNWLDVGADATYLVRPNAIFADAAVDGVGGEGFELYANLHDIKLAARARLVLDSGPFYKIRPVAGVRVGVGSRFLASPELFDPTGGFVLTADTDRTFAPFAGAETGLAWRFSETLQFAVLATATVTDDAQIYGLHLELSRFSYDWF